MGQNFSAVLKAPQFQATLTSPGGAYLPLTGGTMTGPIVLASDPATANQASTKNYVDLQIADLNGVYIRWVPYTGPPQSFLQQDLTRDGDWTMVANKDTSDRPAPQPSGAEEDLLPAWTPTTLSARATFTVANQWSVNADGWVDQYGVDVNTQNANAVHAISLKVNGVVKDSITMTPTTAGMYWQNITPLLVMAGAVLTVTVQVTQVGNNYMYWDQQPGLFATPPPYCSLAQGQKDSAGWNDTAYNCHLLFSPGTISPDWDVVAYGGGASGGGTLQTFSSNDAAKSAGLRQGRWYTDGSGNVKVVF
jgi:hypothetical protein